MTHCGLTLGTSGSSPVFPNDSVPSATLVSQGTLAGQNGQTVSGTAAVYLSGTTYTLRLSGLTVKSETGLQTQVFISSSSSPICTFTLVYYTGNKNYTCSSTAGTFTSVNLYSTSSQKIYGVALLQSVTQ